VIRLLPLADFRFRGIHQAFRRDAPEPFAVDAVNQMLLNVTPDFSRGFQEFFIVLKL
jgi:hypothetical protein